MQISKLWLFLDSLFPADAAELRNGGNPDLAGSELDFVPGGVAEFDLAVFGDFLPGGFDEGAILEDFGLAFADGLDAFVIIVGHGVLLDVHGDDDAGRDRLRFATISEIGDAGGTIIS